MRRTLATVAVVALTLAGATACGSKSDSGGTTGTKVIDITFKGDTVTPNGDKVDVKVGQKIELKVTADKAGEIHLHSSPKEQEKEYAAGSSTIELDPITVPGQVVMESHSLDKTIVTFQVTP